MSGTIQYNPSDGAVNYTVAGGSVQTVIQYASVWSLNRIGVLNWVFDTLGDANFPAAFQPSSAISDVIIKGTTPGGGVEDLFSLTIAGGLTWAELLSIAGCQEMITTPGERILLLSGANIYSYTSAGVYVNVVSLFTSGENHIAVDSNNNIIGTASLNLTNNVKSWTAAGASRWNLTIGTPLFSLLALAIDSNDNAIIVSDRTLYLGTNYSVWSVNSAGSLTWQYDPGYTVTRGVAIDSNNNSLVIGYPSGGVTSIDSSGNFNWSASTNAGFPRAVAVTSADNVIVGDTRSSAVTIYCYDSAGNILWTHDTGSSTVYQIEIDSLDNVIIRCDQAGSNNCKIVSLSWFGGLNWEYNFSQPTSGMNMVLDNFDNVIVTGDRSEL